MKISVAHVNTSKGYRGGERQTELLIRELATRGVRQVLVARCGEPLSSRFGDLDIEIRTVPGGLWGVVRATHGVDLVHVHEGRSIYGAYLRSLISATPYLATRRVNNPIGDHYFAHRAYTRAAYVVAVAHLVAKIVSDYDSATNVRVVYSCSSGLSADSASTKAIRAGLPWSVLVGHVAALDIRQKAQEYIVEVARQLQTSHPEIGFVIVGSGQDEAILKDAARGLTNMTFVGFVENVGDYLAAFDLFILPSRREGIGSILLDAMDFQLPIVASRVGGVPEIVRDGHNGILIDCEKPDQLRAGILTLAESADLRAEMGANGKAISRHYTAETMASKYLELYEHACGYAPAIA
jgi:glycosyltransferase involved in cell wall biosynthesis